MSAQGVISKLERFAWFAVAVILAGVWLFFELIAGYEIPTRAHPILGLLVATALIFGGLDVSQMRKVRSLLAGDLTPRDQKTIADRAAYLEKEDPELVASLRRLSQREPPK